MALAAPIIADLLSLGTYAQDLYERCLLAPIHFREAKSELLALQTALSHLDFLTKSPLFATGGGSGATAKTNVPVSPTAAAIDAGAEKLAIEGPPDESNGNGAVVKANGDLNVATTGTGGAAPNGVHQVTSPTNSPHIPPKTRADIAQLAAGCRGVLQSFERLLEEHQGLNDIPVKPKGRGNGGIMQLFVGRPSGAIDRYKFAQEGVQQVNAIRAKLTYHTGAITLMLTVLGSSSLGRIEGSLSKLETMIAAAAEEKERAHTNNVNYYLLAQQNNLNMSPEKQAYMRQRQKKGMGMGPLEFENLSEQEYYASMNMLSGGGGGMRGGGGPKRLKAKGEKQSGGFWGGGHADSEEFFSNINSWSARPKSSGVLQSSNNRDSKASRDKPREMGFLGSLSRRNTATGVEISMARGSRDESKKREKKQSDDWADYMSPGWGDFRLKKTTKAQRLMLPPTPSKESPTMSGGRGEMTSEMRPKEREGKSSSSNKRRERGDGEKKEKAKKRRSREIDENAGRIEELEDDTEEGEAIAKATEYSSKPEREEASEDKVVEVGASPERDEPNSSASVKSKHSSREQSDAAAAEAKSDRHRRKKAEKEKAVGPGPTKGLGSSAKTRAVPLAPSSPVKQKKFSWGLGESQFINSWEKAERKPVKPVIAIPVPKKNRSVVNLQHGRSRAGKGEDGNAKSMNKSSKPLSEDKERRRQRREQRKARGGKTEDLGGISEEGAPATVEGKSPGTVKKQSEAAPAVEPFVEEETPPAESSEVKEGGEAHPAEGGVAAPAASTEDEAAKKERRKKRKEAKEAAEGKEGEKKPSKHHSSQKSTKDKDHHHESSSRSAEKGKEKERTKEYREEKHRDEEKKDKLRRQNTEPITEKEKKEHKSRSKRAPGDKAGMKSDYEKDIELRRKMKEREAQAQQPASSSLWSKKVLAVARFSMGGQKQEETRRKSGK
ncbi:hypothetical protein EV426DRAFT_138644 [Tirmania nivea]|nr:hypothetical protein EV426DRAFT_138644 [Tirmania nivea]